MASSPDASGAPTIRTTVLADTKLKLDLFSRIDDAYRTMSSGAAAGIVSDARIAGAKTVVGMLLAPTTHHVDKFREAATELGKELDKSATATSNAFVKFKSYIDKNKTSSSTNINTAIKDAIKAADDFVAHWNIPDRIGKALNDNIETSEKQNFNMFGQRRHKTRVEKVSVLMGSRQVYMKNLLAKRALLLPKYKAELPALDQIATWSTSMTTVQEVVDAVQALRGQLEELRTRIEEGGSEVNLFDPSGSGRPIDTTKNTLDSMLKQLAAGSRPLEDLLSGYTASDAALFTDLTSVNTLYSRMAARVMELASGAAKILGQLTDTLVKAKRLRPADKRDAPQVDATIKKMQAAHAAVQALSTDLMHTVTDPRKPNVLASAVLALNDINGMEPLSKLGPALEVRLLTPGTSAATGASGWTPTSLGKLLGTSPASPSSPSSGYAGLLRPTSLEGRVDTRVEAPGYAMTAEAVGPGDRAGFLYRTADINIMRRMVGLLRAHLEAVKASPLETRVTNLLARLKSRLSDLADQLARVNDGGEPQGGVPMDEGLREHKRKALADAKVEALLGFEKSVRSALRSYVRFQLRFVTQKHRSAFQYMSYWDAMRPYLTDEAKQVIDDHTTQRADLLKLVQETLQSVQSRVTDAYQEGSQASSGLALDEGRGRVVDEAFDAHYRWMGQQADRLQGLYASGRASLLDELTEPGVLVIYALKVVRLLCAYMALRISERSFQNMYDERVYGTTAGLPPSPFIFVAMFLAVDLSMVALVVVAVVLMRRLMKGNDDFPVDGNVLQAWGVDVVASTALVAAVACVIANVVRNKKYFRYKYEGDRGVRAMRAMVFNVYCVALALPFFRLTFT